VGTRSAVFAPLADLGLVVVDEEHDPSYKQGESPRYHGRDLAVVRARAAGAVVLLGSATPSLESFAHARSGRYGLLRLGGRVHARALAAVQVVDMRREFLQTGAARPSPVRSSPRSVSAWIDGNRRSCSGTAAAGRSRSSARPAARA
jgi:primosomal protein N' (replication factor Y)